ncbi:MAG: carbohydrate ABC transporter permease [bacterium]|nr:carbohydrate ABC transporter permease [Candidatus Sumerlaeota bacterium]
MLIRLARYLLLTIGGIAFAVPLFWMVSTSLKPDTELFSGALWPRSPMWSNYERAVQSFPFMRYGANTVLLTMINIIGCVISSAMAGYAFSRLRWPGRDAIFFVLLSTMMIPPQVTMIPVFLLFRWLGWYNTYLPLTVPAFLGGAAFFIFLMRQFFRTLPRDLEEAARIDGCSQLRIFWSVMLPLTKPALATVGIFTFVGVWNDFMTPLIYLSDGNLYTLALGLQSFVTESLTEWNLMMAASTLVLIPLLALFFFAQRYFVEGIALTGSKG